MTQMILNACLDACAILPVALDVWLVYRVCRFFPFTTSAVFTLVPYLVCSFSFVLGSGASTLLAFSLALTLLFPIGWYIASRVASCQEASLQLFLLSLGILVLTQNSLSIVYGSQPIPLDMSMRESLFHFPFGSFGLSRALIFLWGMMSLALISLLHCKTSLGKRWQAIASDPELSKIVGVSIKGAIAAALATGAILTGGAGILQGLDTALTPHMGLSVFMQSVVVVVIGGRRISGVVGVCFAMVFLQDLIAYMIGTQWHEMVAFSLLLLYMVVYPRGARSHTSSFIGCQ